MATSTRLMKVTDVYEMAAAVGKDFESIIDQFGGESVNSLMPKVIRVLESLEECALQRETDRSELNKLQSIIERLEAEKSIRNEERNRYEKEVEQLEESWRSETQQLSDSIAKLEEENNMLRTLLERQRNESEKRHSEERSANNSDKPQHVDVDSSALSSERLRHSSVRDSARNSYAEDASADDRCTPSSSNTATLLNKLKSEINALKRESRELRKEAVTARADADAYFVELRRIARVSAEYRAIHCDRDERIAALSDEKADLDAQLDAKSRLLDSVEQQLRASRFDLFTSCIQPASSTLSIDERPNDETPFARGNDRQSRAAALANSVSLNECALTSATALDGDSVLELTRYPSAASLNGESRPCSGAFSLNELAVLMRERNTLRARLIEVETELNLYKAVEEAASEQRVVIIRTADEADKATLPQGQTSQSNRASSANINVVFKKLVEKIK